MFIFGTQIAIEVFYKLIHFGCVWPGMPKVPKIRNSHIFAIVQKTWGMKFFA